MGKRTLGLRAVVLVALAAIGLLAGASLMRPAPQSAEATSLTEIKKLLASDAQAGDQFGGRVTVSGDTAVVGASQEGEAGDNAGAAYTFRRDEGRGGHWGQVKKPAPSGAQADDRLGPSGAGVGRRVVVSSWRGMADGEGLAVGKRDCMVALDGERAFSVKRSEQLEMEVRRDGPPIVDVDLALKVAAAKGLFNLAQGS